MRDLWQSTADISDEDNNEHFLSFFQRNSKENIQQNIL